MILSKIKDLFGIDDNWGYSTPKQKRFKIGQVVKVSNKRSINSIFEIGDSVAIVETGRHDYLVGNEKGKECVYQFELEE